MPIEANKLQFTFEVGAFGPDDLQVVDFTGREAISQPYEFRIRLVAGTPNVAFEDVLNKPTVFTLFRDDAEEKHHGVIVDFEAGERADADRVFYHAVVVPRLWLLGMTQQSRVFQNKNVRDIVTEVLKGGGLSGGDVKWSLSKSYPAREYVVQYQESDLAFVSRLLEHEGIFYTFDNHGEHETLVISDDPKSFSSILDPDEVPFRTAGGMAGEVPERVSQFSVREKLVQSKVLLRDYNYRTPETQLKAESQMNSKGVGMYYAYGDHFKNQDEGNRLARVRNEEIECMRVVATGGSDCRGLRAGHTFGLKEHFRDDHNQDWLILDLEHVGSQAQALQVQGMDGTPTYVNRFTCIPATAPYRPPRITPKPRVDGSMHAVIDAAGSGQYAEIDDHGRYKVKLPFDLAESQKGQGSRYIRMAQPYAGADFGMHFPLHKGTEVLLTHVDGDLDRPVIAGAVPNPATGSPVKSGNKSQCVIRTGGNNQIQMEDSDGGQRITMSTPTEDTTFSMGAPNSPGPGFDFKTAAHWHLKALGNAISNVTGNWEAYITGNVKWQGSGNVNETFTGSKTTFLSGQSTEQVAGAKWEHVGGFKTEILVGAYTNITGGLKTEIGKGAKISKFSGPDLVMAPSIDLHAKVVVDVKAPKVKIDGTGVAALCSGGASRVEVKPAMIDTVSTKILVDAEAELLLKGGGSSIKLTGGSIELKCGGSSLTLDSGGTITLKGSDVAIKAGGEKITLGEGMVLSSSNIHLYGNVIEK